MRSPGTTSAHCAVHRLPGLPLAGPSSHCSLHSTMPSPHTSARQVAAQPSHDAWFPSSHCSPTSIVPLPHTAVFGMQTRFTLLSRMRAPAPSCAAMVSSLVPASPGACGTLMVAGAVQ